MSDFEISGRLRGRTEWLELVGCCPTTLRLCRLSHVEAWTRETVNFGSTSCARLARQTARMSDLEEVPTSRRLDMLTSRRAQEPRALF